MDAEEFLNFLKQFKADLREATNYKKACTKKLSEELFSFIFKHFPMYEPYRATLSAQLKPTCNDCSLLVVQMLSTAFHSQQNNTPYKHNSRDPKIKSKAKSAKELQDLIAEIKQVKNISAEDLKVVLT